jgi:hypothetical protein
MDYEIKIDGTWGAKRPWTGDPKKMFTRGDMAFWGFSSDDVRPPAGHALAFLPDGEPYFKTLEQP